MKIFTTFFCAILVCTSVRVFGQDAVSTVIVEHFTNTLCSVCNSVNPGIISTLNNNPDILHISYHPSSPYSGCTINKSNKKENDDRTNYYGIYGSTPKLVVQGQTSSISVLQSAITSASGKTSTARMNVSLVWKGTDTLIATAVVKSITSLPQTLSVYFGLAEKLYKFSSQNGEKEHHDVFRKSFTSAAGTPITLNGVGDSVVLTESIPYNSLWASKFYSFGILSNPSNKQIIQSAISTLLDPANRISSVPTETASMFSLQPNPTVYEKGITITSDDNNLNGSIYVIYTILGDVVKRGEIELGKSINIAGLPIGTYTISINGNSRKFIVE